MTGEDFYNYYRGLVYESGPWAHLTPAEKNVWRKLSEKTVCECEVNYQYGYDAGYSDGAVSSYDIGYEDGYFQARRELEVAKS